MPGQPIPSELKEKGLIWLLPPYCWSHRQIARKLKISASVVSKWRCELVEQGLLPENEKITSVDVEDWTPERRFSVVLETATLSVTNGAIVIHTQRLKSDPGGNLLS